MKGMELLGLKVQDKVTNQRGVVISISHDLYGCIQAVVTPETVKNKNEDANWYDIERLKVLSKNPVMKLPDFDEEDYEEHGPALKPIK